MVPARYLHALTESSIVMAGYPAERPAPTQVHSVSVRVPHCNGYGQLVGSVARGCDIGKETGRAAQQCTCDGGSGAIDKGTVVKGCAEDVSDAPNHLLGSDAM